MATKIEFNLEELAAGPSILKAGDKVGFEFHPESTSATCTTQEGVLLGRVPAEFVEKLIGGSSVHGVVRTVRRSPDDSSLLTVIVRCAAGELSTLLIEEQTLVEEEEEDDIMRLNQEQLEQLAADDKVRWFLRDERLQQCIKEVDSAPNREQALLKALEAPNFKEFADHVLHTGAPDPL